MKLEIKSLTINAQLKHNSKENVQNLENNTVLFCIEYIYFVEKTSETKLLLQFIVYFKTFQLPNNSLRFTFV